MTSLILPYERENAKTVVKATFEMVDGVDNYVDEGQRVVGKQDASLMGGNGAKVTVDVPEVQSNEDSTEISVSAEKNVQIDMSTDEGELESEFLTIVNTLREKEFEEILDAMDGHVDASNTKEVTSAAEFGNDQSTLGLRFIVMFVLIMLFTLMMTAVMMP